MTPAWNTPTVRALLAAGPKAGDPSNYPVLADALEEAGCDDPVILGYLRDPASQADGLVEYLPRVLAGVAPAAIRRAIAHLTAVAGRTMTHYEWEYPAGPDGEPDYNAEGEIRPDGYHDFAWIMAVLGGCAGPDKGKDPSGWGYGPGWCFGYDTPDELCSRESVRKLWESYEVLTGTPVPTKTYYSWGTDETSTDLVYPFHCAC